MTGSGEAALLRRGLSRGGTPTDGYIWPWLCLFIPIGVPDPLSDPLWLCPVPCIISGIGACCAAMREARLEARSAGVGPIAPAPIPTPPVPAPAPEAEAGIGDGDGDGTGKMLSFPPLLWRSTWLIIWALLRRI